MSFTVKANFIDVFKIGDNINYNLRILKVLYETYNNSPENERLMIKPIVIINTSIAEAILYDFVLNRLKRPNRTEMLFSDVWLAMQGKEFTKFQHYIAQIEKYDFFEMKDTNFYDAMRSLSAKRNRIHIQNDKNQLPADEGILFDKRAKVLSEKVLEKILNTMTIKYPRREEYQGFVRDFELPWDRHFPTPEPVEPDLTLEEALDLGLI